MDNEKFLEQMKEDERKDEQWQEILSYYGGQKVAGNQENVVALLREVQELYGFIPSEKIARIAETLGVKDSFVSQLIKLYPSFKKAPYKHCITVCTGARCGDHSSSEVFNAVLKAVETQETSAFKITMKECFKECKTAPNIWVDNDSYGSVKPEEVASILSRY